jgi:hypothetical protein
MRAVWGRRELVAFGAALAVVVVVAVGYGLASGRRVGAEPASGREARVERLLDPDGGPVAPVTDDERRTATERLRAKCRDLEVRLTYNGPLEARPATEPGSTRPGGLCDRQVLTDRDVQVLRYAPAPPPGEVLFANEQQLAEWKRAQACREPRFREVTSSRDDPLHGFCTKPTLGPAELRALRLLYVADPVAAERTRVQRERELENLRRGAATGG